MTATILALVGATGGAGTTRTCVETAALAARAGRSVRVLDAAFGTQGLAEYLPGQLAPDATALVTDDAEERLAAALTDFPVDAPPLPPAEAVGEVTCCPASAPFERLARAKTPEAAQALAERIGEAAAGTDLVLVDTPPLATNPAVAAVHAADRVAVVAPHTVRGVSAVQRTRDRLADVGTAMDTSVGVDLPGRTTAPPDGDVDAVVPRLSPGDLTDAPAVAADSVARAWLPPVETVLGDGLGVAFEGRPSLTERVERFRAR